MAGTARDVNRTARENAVKKFNELAERLGVDAGSWPVAAPPYNTKYRRVALALVAFVSHPVFYLVL